MPPKKYHCGPGRGRTSERIANESIETGIKLLEDNIEFLSNENAIKIAELINCKTFCVILDMTKNLNEQIGSLLENEKQLLAFELGVNCIRGVEGSKKFPVDKLEDLSHFEPNEYYNKCEPVVKVFLDGMTPKSVVPGLLA